MTIEHTPIYLALTAELDARNTVADTTETAQQQVSDALGYLVADGSYDDDNNVFTHLVAEIATEHSELYENSKGTTLSRFSETGNNIMSKLRSRMARATKDLWPDMYEAGEKYTVKRVNKHYCLAIATRQSTPENELVTLAKAFVKTPTEAIALEMATIVRLALEAGGDSEA